MLIDTKFNKSVSLLTWGYNEEDSIVSFLDSAFSLLNQCVEDFEVIYVDDGSTDNSYSILVAYCLKEPRLKVIRHVTNKNVGFSCRSAISAATKDFLFWQTVDWAYDIRNLRIFLELLLFYDVVQGIRPIPIRLITYIPIIKSFFRLRTRSDNLKKAIVSLVNYYLIKILFGANFSDFQNVTFYPTRLIQSVLLKSTTSFVNPECMLKTYSLNKTFIEVPINFLPRIAGQAKGTRLNSIVRSVKDIIYFWLRWGIKYRLNKQKFKSKIFRVSHPFNLSVEVITLVSPLLKYFR